MAKYYVSSGSLRVVIDRPTAKEAAIQAFESKAAECDRLGLFTRISETGFDEVKEDDMYYPTEALLKEVGLGEMFRAEEEE